MVTVPTTTQTTFERYPPGWYQNYCTRPTHDVEILDPERRCAVCGDTLTFVKQGFSFGWVHDNATEPDLRTYEVKQPGDTRHRPAPRGRCSFCGAENGQVVDGETVHLFPSHHAWHDQVECSRCGGISGFPIGD